MRKTSQIFSVLGLLLLPQWLGAQVIYHQKTDVPAREANGKRLPNAWAGGLNAIQYHTIDLNLDGQTDLLLFDRTSGCLLPFLSRKKRYHYAPEYISAFPKIEAWLVLADYDRDGKKDIFTHGNLGVKVFKNISENNTLRFRSYGTPKTKGFSGTQIPLQVDITDVPAIVDVDNDGDLDLLTFLTPNVGGTVEYNQNMSVERFGRPDTLIFEKTTARWGGFEEKGTCRTYLFDKNKRVQHAGSSILAIDLDNDQDKDLIIGEIACTNLVQMTNEGTPRKAVFKEALFDYPPKKPVDLHIFPAAFYEDVNFDGKKDLLVSPNIAYNEGFRADFRHSSLLYLNQGTAEIPDFVFAQNNFLQDQMLDFGESAFPLLADADQDGDADLWVGSMGAKTSEGEFKASVAFFENIGTPKNPDFNLKNADFLHLSALNRIEITPIWADLNQDQRPDFAFTSREKGKNLTLHYFLNEGKKFSDTMQEISVDGLQIQDKVAFFDIDEDNDPDIILGKANGALELHENQGNGKFVKTNAALGGIKADFFARQASPVVADINGDGKADLLLGSQEGFLTVYFSIRTQPPGKWEGKDILLQNPLNNRPEKRYFGQGVYPAAFGDLLVAGSVGGGLLLMSQNAPKVSAIVQKKPRLQHVFCYPNPAKSQIYIQNSGDKPLSAQLFTPLGKIVSELWHIGRRQTKCVALPKLPAGFYLLRLQEGKKWASRKILIDP